MWGIFGKPSNIPQVRNTPGLHAVLTTYLRPFWTVPVLLAASFCQQAAPMSAYKFTPRAVASPGPAPAARVLRGGGGGMGEVRSQENFVMFCTHIWIPHKMLSNLRKHTSGGHQTLPADNMLKNIFRRLWRQVGAKM